MSTAIKDTVGYHRAQEHFAALFANGILRDLELRLQTSTLDYVEAAVLVDPESNSREHTRKVAQALFPWAEVRPVPKEDGGEPGDVYLKLKRTQFEGNRVPVNPEETYKVADKAGMLKLAWNDAFKRHSVERVIAKLTDKRGPTATLLRMAKVEGATPQDYVTVAESKVGHLVDVSPAVTGGVWLTRRRTADLPQAVLFDARAKDILTDLKTRAEHGDPAPWAEQYIGKGSDDPGVRAALEAQLPGCHVSNGRREGWVHIALQYDRTLEDEADLRDALKREKALANRAVKRLMRKLETLCDDTAEKVTVTLGNKDYASNEEFEARAAELFDGKGEKSDVLPGTYKVTFAPVVPEVTGYASALALLGEEGIDSALARERKRAAAEKARQVEAYVQHWLVDNAKSLREKVIKGTVVDDAVNVRFIMPRTGFEANARDLATNIAARLGKRWCAWPADIADPQTHAWALRLTYSVAEPTSGD